MEYGKNLKMDLKNFRILPITNIQSCWLDTMGWEVRRFCASQTGNYRKAKSTHFLAFTRSQQHFLKLHQLNLSPIHSYKEVLKPCSSLSPHSLPIMYLPKPAFFLSNKNTQANASLWESSPTPSSTPHQSHIHPTPLPPNPTIPITNPIPRTRHIPINNHSKRHRRHLRPWVSCTQTNMPS